VVNDPSPNGPAPYKLEDNNYSILDISDIVMMDPVGTGLSRAVGKAKNSDFWGVDEDIKSVSQFIRNYVNDNDDGTRQNIYWAKAMEHSVPQVLLIICKRTLASQ
jgi:carboxypeptidase C (cathepsin A)